MVKKGEKIVFFGIDKFFFKSNIYYVKMKELEGWREKEDGG